MGIRMPKKTIFGRRNQETKSGDCSGEKCKEEIVLATGREW